MVKYWGWHKYRYWETLKVNFAAAKEKAFEVLDACPPEVIQRFINRSWRFIDAFRNGLTGWAAARVVRKQKGHWSVSEKAMKVLEEVKAQAK
jgi:hypothetical protein